MTTGARIRGPAPCLLGLLGLLAVSCGNIDGTDPYALWRTYEDPGRAFHFHYPSPPWTESDDAAFGLPIFEIDPDDDPLAELPAARLRLEARMYVPSSIDEIVALESGTWHTLGYSTSPVEEFVNTAGDVGALVEARRDDKWAEQVFFEEGGTVATLLIWGTGDAPHAADVELLLEGFEPRGAEAL